MSTSRGKETRSAPPPRLPPLKRHGAPGTSLAPRPPRRASLYDAHLRALRRRSLEGCVMIPLAGVTQLRRPAPDAASCGDFLSPPLVRSLLLSRYTTFHRMHRNKTCFDLLKSPTWVLPAERARRGLVTLQCRYCIKLFRSIHHVTRKKEEKKKRNRENAVTVRSGCRRVPTLVTGGVA